MHLGAVASESVESEGKDHPVTRGSLDWLPLTGLLPLQRLFSRIEARPERGYLVLVAPNHWLFYHAAIIAQFRHTTPASSMASA